jgi:hypothetical protein
MTRTIETQFPRTLVLENVAQLRPRSLEPAEVRRAAITLGRHIRDAGGSPVGPLIQRVRPDPRSSAGREPRHETVLMRQSDAPTEASGAIAVDDRIEVGGCVLARFRGDASDLDVVYDKLSVFAYEQEIELDGTVYLVIVGEDGMTLSVDAFAPVSSSGSHANR